MRCLLACLVVLGAVSGARALPPILPAAERARTVPAGVFVEDPAGRGRAAAARGDTIWFGGDDGGGVAFEGGVWDWEAIVADPLQGWTRVDATQNDAVHFARVSASSFAGDPCVPMIENTAGMLWCGVHEDEALCRGYATGMGYGNDFRQSARSPSLAIDWAQEALQIEFAYFNDTEPDYDYTHIYVLCYDAGGALVEEHWVAGLTGVLGSAASPALFQQTIAAGTLSPLARSVALELRMVSDGGWSDEDGLYDSACGPFAADEVVLRVGAQPVVRFDFDDGPQGWDFAAYPGLGAYMTSIPEEVWRNWIPVPCGLSGRVLGFVDPQDRRHPGGHHEFGYSAPLPRGG
ncbi:MAG: hypothetical protein FJY75_13150, partial [Candidatus Eisenbacteria bacterium]|nr:hypothetical protein [Candidatus Eisenbacteria bacterium]